MARKKIWIAFAASVLAFSSPAAMSQPYPNKPVRIVVGFAAGGNIDITARIVAAKLSELWGASVVVENRPGAGSSVAAGFVAKAPADGYTLLTCTSSTHGINSAIFKSLPYDPVKDFTPVSLVGLTQNALIAHSSLGVNTVQELIALAKKNPGRLSIASPGIGASQHLSIGLFMSIAGVDLVHVPYKGGSAALTDLLGGQVPLMMSAVPTALGAIKSATVRVLGVTGAARSAQLPGVPTIAESGFPGYDVATWTGICAPAGLPSALAEKLNADLVKVISKSETKQRLAEQGVEAASNTPIQFAALIKAEIAKWPEVVKAAGITRE